MKTDAGARFLDAATIQERLDDVELLERRIAEDPADLVASERLEGIYRRGGDWPKLIQILLDRAEACPSPAENAQILREVAQVYMERLGEQIP